MRTQAGVPGRSLIHNPLLEREKPRVECEGIKAVHTAPPPPKKILGSIENALTGRDLKVLHQLGKEVTKDLPSHRVCL